MSGGLDQFEPDTMNLSAQGDTPDHSHHFSEPLPHESQLPLFSLWGGTGFIGGEAEDVLHRKERCTDGWFWGHV